MSASAPQLTQLTIREVLKLKPVRRLWAAQVVSVFGDFLAIFAVLSYVSFNLHASAAQVTLISVSFMIPFALIGPIAGVFVDRWNVKRTMIASDLIRAALAVLLVFATNLNQIYAILFALSTVSSFFIPAQSVTVRVIVPTAGLMAANALMAQAIQVMQIVSPAISGALVAWFSPSACFWLDTASFLFSAAMISTLVIDHQPKTGALNLKSVIAQMGAGMKFIFTHSAVSFVIISMTVGMFAIRCFGALLAVYVRDILHAGSFLFGALSSMIG